MPNKSIKHLQIGKANQTVIAATAIAVIIVVFGLFLGRGVWARYSHQEQVIKAKETALKQLSANIEARDEVVESYRQFVDTSSGKNIIGGDPLDIEGARGGDNARIVLDALPSKYDFTALVTSVDNLLRSSSFTASAIEGVDQEVEQATQQGVADPEPVSIPIGVNVEGVSYEESQDIISLFERSIRPFAIQTLNIEAAGGDVSVTLKMNTYYQPEKAFVIEKKVIK